MLNNILIKAFLLSFSASIIALIIFAIRPFIRSIFSKSWQYYIWLVVILRLLIPYTPKNNLMRSFYYFLEENNQVFSILTNSLINSNVIFYIGIVWLSITVFLMLKKVISYHVYVSFIKANSKEIDNFNITQIFNEVCKEMRLKNKIRLYSYKMINSPMLIGFLKPCIVLPDNILNKTHDLRYILKHEITHYKRKDFIYKWLIEIIICLYFFNPVVYLIRNIVNKYCELSCDEVLIKKLDKHGKKAYGSALINALEINNGFKQHTAVSLMLCEDAKDIKERLGAILLYKQESVIMFVFAFLLSCFIGLFSIFIGVFASGICICI